MVRWRWLLWLAAVAVFGGCGSAGNTVNGDDPAGDGSDRLHQQARDALARYDKAVLDAGGKTSLIMVGGELTGQVGNWEPDNGDNNKLALNSGRVVAAAALPAEPPPPGRVVWENGDAETVALISADAALKELQATGADGCGKCVPLQVTGARLGTARIETTRGPATVPAWEYTLKGTAVRATRAAIARPAVVTVTPPSWDPYDAPGGLAIDSATTTGSKRRLTVTFTGAPGPATKPCGSDYSAEAVESANAVVVIVYAHPNADGGFCTSIGAMRTADVELARPLGERTVLEVQQGMPVPVTIS